MNVEKKMKNSLTNNRLQWLQQSLRILKSRVNTIVQVMEKFAPNLAVFLFYYNSESIRAVSKKLTKS